MVIHPNQGKRSVLLAEQRSCLNEETFSWSYPFLLKTLVWGLYVPWWWQTLVWALNVRDCKRHCGCDGISVWRLHAHWCGCEDRMMWDCEGRWCEDWIPHDCERHALRTECPWVWVMSMYYLFKNKNISEKINRKRSKCSLGCFLNFHYSRTR